MRRLIAYITMAISMLIAIGVAATPVLTKLNTGREFTQGHEIIFKLESKDENALPEDAAEKVADEMRNRLANYQLEDYSVKVQGNDTVTACFAVDQGEFDLVAKYLCFSGGNFAFTGEEETTLKQLSNDDFKASEARIVYEEDTIPVVVIPVQNTAKDAIEEIIKTLNPEEEAAAPDRSLPLMHMEDPETSGEGESDSPAGPDMFLISNYEEGDSYESAQYNPLVREKILMSFYSENIWYTKSDEEKTEIAFMCATATQDNQLDLSALKDDNVKANYLLNMLHASTYEYSVVCPTRNVTSQGVTYFENAIELAPSAENLFKLGSNITLAMSTTLIATLVAFVIVSLLLVVYYRLSALGMIATTLSTIFVTFLSFRGMNVIFNMPAIIGFIILAGTILFGEIVYVNRFKEEVYKGRALKKANQEASKKANLLTLDASIITAFAGLMMYVLGGTALKPMGVVLFFGAVFALLMNLIVFKILMKFVTNSTNLANKYSVFNIDGDKVPNLMSATEKPEYKGAYEETDFTKKRKLSGIILGALALASVVVISVFGAIDGSPLNVKNATANSTVIYTTLKAENPLINNEEEFKENALYNLKIADDAKVIEAENVEMKKVTNTIFHSKDDIEPVESLYFITTINNEFNDEELEYLSESVRLGLVDKGLSSDDIVCEAKTSKELIYTPDQGSVALATGIAIVGCALYFAFRFRPSRGISVLISTAGATAIAYGVLVATRVGTTAVTSLAMPIVALTMLLASLFYLSTEKAMLKESKNELSREVRKDIMIKSLGKSASPMLVFMLLMIYISINYFGFGLAQTAFLFASALIGEIVAVVALLTIVGPFACVLEKLFSKISLPKLKIFEKKEKGNTQHKHNSSEPEETIFIGIND